MKYRAVVKKCSRCSQVLLAESFEKNASQQDGLSSWCKICRSVYKTVNLEKYKERARRYYKLHPKPAKPKQVVCQKDQRANNIKSSRKYQKKYPVRVRAHHALMRAIKAGEVVRPNSCSKCSKECTPEGHHEDYFLPLAVIWLCYTCHRERSKELRDNKQDLRPRDRAKL